MNEQHQQHRQLLNAMERINVYGEYLGLIVLSGLFMVGIYATVCVVQKRRRQQRQIILARRRARRASAAAAAANHHHDHHFSSSIIRQRKAHIEAYLVTKPALAHDDVCDCARGVAGRTAAGTAAIIPKEGAASALNLVPASSRGGEGCGDSGVLLKTYFIKPVMLPGGGPVISAGKGHSDVEEGNYYCRDVDNSANQQQDEEVEGCTICFESFEPNDLVSWSPNPACCKRVFHHACYMEWLLRNKHCPWCREIVLPVDGYSDVKTTKRQILDLLIGQQQRATPSFYCCTHGTVRPKLRGVGYAATTITTTSTLQQLVLRQSNGERSTPSSFGTSATASAIANLITERSTYLCGRDEILRSSTTNVSMLFGTTNAKQQQHHQEPIDSSATSRAPAGPALVLHSNHVEPPQSDATTTAIHDEGVFHCNDSRRRLDDLAMGNSSNEQNYEQSNDLPMDIEDQHIAGKVDEEEEKDVDTSDESSSSSLLIANNGSSVCPRH